MKTLIQVEQLKPILQQTQVRVFDCRFSLQNPSAGLRAYERGHIAGAMFADMNQDLSTPHIPGVTGRHPLPDREAWINKVRNWGLDPESLIVMYDDTGGTGAARMWWMLKWIGHENAVVLDGGWQAWQAVGGDVATAQPKARAATADNYSQLAPLVQLVSATDIDSDMQLLLDARDAVRFRGEADPIDPVAGHIPGAQCSPYTGNLREDLKLKSGEELREKFSDVAHTFLQVVCYCGSGVTACHNVLAIAHAGLTLPALYAGSWSEWITDPAHPVATGA